MLEVNQAVPSFRLEGDDGKMHTLEDAKGKLCVLYFYPKDDTPGCTTEACDFRDSLQRISNLGAVLYGISKDSIESHEKFSAKHGLNFTLLSDPDLAVHEAYGALAEGRTVRSTFLIGREGQLLKAWYKVNVKDHVNQVIAALESGL